MNWKEIKEKYPKALSKCTNIGIDIIRVSDFSKYQPPRGLRFLYDFFDEQGIYIEILKMFDGSYTTKTGFYFYIDDYTKDEYNAGSRTEAEEQAFLKAFEILENKL